MDEGEEGLTAARADALVARLAGWLDRNERRDGSRALLQSELAGLAGRPRVVDAIARAVHRFTADERPERREAVAAVLNGWGLVLCLAEQEEAAIAADDELVRRFAAAAEPALVRAVAWALLDRGLGHHWLGRHERALSEFDEALRRVGAPVDEDGLRLAVSAVYNRGLCLEALDRAEEAVAAYDEVLRRLGDDQHGYRGELAIHALSRRGIVLSRSDAALASFDELLRRAGPAEEGDLAATVSGTLVDRAITLHLLGRGDALDAARAALSRADRLGHDQAAAGALFTLGDQLGDAGRTDEALGVMRALVDRFGESDEWWAQWRVAGALVATGTMLDARGDPDGALGAHREALRRVGERPSSPNIGEEAAAALASIVQVLARSGRPGEAIAAADEAIARIDAWTDVRAPVSRAAAQYNRARALADLDRWAEAREEYRALVTRFADRAELRLRWYVAWALYALVDAPGASFDAVLADWSELERRFGDAGDPGLVEAVASAMSRFAWALDRQGRREEAVAVFDRLVERYADDPDPAAQVAVARAAVDRADRLGTLGQRPAELAGYDAVVATWGGAADPGVLAQVMRARHYQGLALVADGRAEEAVTAYRDALTRSEAAGVAARHSAAWSLARLVEMLVPLGRPAEALTACEAYLGQLMEDGEAELVEPLARALYWQARALWQLERHEDATSICRRIIDRFGVLEAAIACYWTARAYDLMARGLRALDRLEESLRACEEAVARFGPDQRYAVRWCVNEAIACAGAVLESMRRTAEAIARYRSIIERIGEPATAADSQQIGRAMDRLAVLGAATVEETVACLADRRDPALVRSLAAAVQQGISQLERLDHVEEALAAAGEVAARFAGDDDEAVVELVAWALHVAGRLLVKLGRVDEGLARLDEAARRFRDAAGAGARQQAARARYLQGLVLGREGRWDEAERAHRDVANRVGSTSDLPSRQLAAEALAGLGVVLRRRARWGQALVVCDQLLANVGDAPEPELRPIVARALRDRCRTLSYLGRIGESAAAAADVVDRFREDDDPRVRAVVSDAMVMQLIDLFGLERYEEALVRAEASRDWFGEPSEPGLRLDLAQVELLRAIVLGGLGREADAKRLVSETAARFAPELTAHLDRMTAILDTRPATLGRAVGRVLRQGGMARRDLLALREALAALSGAERPDEQLLERAQSLLASMAMFAAPGAE